MIEIPTKQIDTFQWRVVYQDGTGTSEYDEERPDGRGFAEILPKPVTEVWLTPWGPEDECLVRVLVPSDATPVFFRRRVIELSPNDVATRSTKHCIGWTRGEEGVYLFVLEDGSVLLSSDLQAV